MRLAGYICRALCQRHDKLHLTTFVQYKTAFIQKVSISTSIKSNGWVYEKLSGGKMETVMKKIFRYSGITANEKEKLAFAAARLSVSCSEYSNFPLFRERFHLEDTFAAWVNVLTLHTWMLNVRFSNHHDNTLEADFEFLKKQTSALTWNDIIARAKKIAKGSKRKKGLRTIADRYLVMVMAYDEGYLSNDKMLAGALWNSLFDRRNDVEPKQLLELVDYVHKNMHHLESISNTQVLEGYVSFLPLDSDKPDPVEDQRIHQLLSAI